jgi:hypothetical protein
VGGGIAGVEGRAGFWGLFSPRSYYNFVFFSPRCARWLRLYVEDPLGGEVKTTKIKRAKRTVILAPFKTTICLYVRFNLTPRQSTVASLS